MLVSFTYQRYHMLHVNLKHVETPDALNHIVWLYSYAYMYIMWCNLLHSINMYGTSFEHSWCLFVRGTEHAGQTQRQGLKLSSRDCFYISDGSFDVVWAGGAYHQRRPCRSSLPDDGRILRWFHARLIRFSQSSIKSSHDFYSPSFAPVDGVKGFFGAGFVLGPPHRWSMRRRRVRRD